MGSCMVKKFADYTDLTNQEKSLLLRLEENEETYQSGQLIREKNQDADHLYVVKKGWSFISNTIDKNMRSIFDIRISGDFIGISELSFSSALYDIRATTDVTVCPFPKSALNEIFVESPKLCRMFFAILSREQALLYARVFSLGRRTALEKVAHLILEMSFRTTRAYGEQNDEFSFPIKQEEIADLLGLSTVHVNRCMNELKRHNYIEYNRSGIKILNRNKLMNLSEFEKQFLEPIDLKWHKSGN